MSVCGKESQMVISCKGGFIMDKIILFNPAGGTLNSGDFIIDKYIKEEMDFLFSKSIIAEIGTHLPVAHMYQNVRRNITRRACDEATYKFLCGSSMIKTSLIRLSPDWSLTPSSCPYYRNSIAIGIGIGKNSSYFDPYTRYIYNNIFSKEYIHSTRDEKTKLFLEKMGLRAINTGCPTLWGLTEDFCRQIPHARKRKVIFTLTYNNPAPEDKVLIDILADEYDELYFWVQGFGDLDYLNSIKDNKKIKIIGHALSDYERILTNGEDFDYVGMRLHAGIFAIRHKVRSIIISIDNRADDMKETYNLPIIHRSRIQNELRGYINSKYETSIKIPVERINCWKEQFR